jgi:hypothetical protein
MNDDERDDIVLCQMIEDGIFPELERAKSLDDFLVMAAARGENLFGTVRRDTMLQRLYVLRWPGKDSRI